MDTEPVIGTTNIYDLPINQHQPPQSVSTEQKIMETDSNLSHTINPGIDPNNTKMHKDKDIERQKRGVQFKEPIVEQSSSSRSSKDIISRYLEKDNIKLIILVSVLMFIFMDSRFKGFVSNILIQLFGQLVTVSSSSNALSNIGNMLYIGIFGLVLYIILSSIDINNVKF